MELNNVEEYLKNAQESKRLSKDSYGLGAGVDTSAVSSEKSEPLPPPLPPRYVCFHLYCLVVGYSLVCGCWLQINCRCYITILLLQI